MARGREINVLAHAIACEIELALDIEPKRIGIVRVEAVCIKHDLQAIMLDIRISHVNLDVLGSVSGTRRRRIREYTTHRLERNLDLRVGLEHPTADSLTFLDARDCLLRATIVIYHVPNFRKPVSRVNSPASAGSIDGIGRVRVSHHLDAISDSSKTILIE